MTSQDEKESNSKVKDAALWWVTPRGELWPAKKRLRGIAIIGIVFAAFLTFMYITSLASPNRGGEAQMTSSEMALLCTVLLCFLPSLLALILAAFPGSKNKDILKKVCTVALVLSLAGSVIIFTGDTKEEAIIFLFGALTNFCLLLLAKGVEN